ncbi:uncharacterized protein LOC127811037 isoform X2 [Diospyros lotus]|uniref:uncharacterized protein LOC127811037 isoform X2 n=1 Tax=Diospyros lotus TaxID=55363 RepID=UPI00225590D0|nr:uncharacterized protein LOC127811037 isoform X2 [Diospyros lotus]
MKARGGCISDHFCSDAGQRRRLRWWPGRYDGQPQPEPPPPLQPATATATAIARLVWMEMEQLTTLNLSLQLCTNKLERDDHLYKAFQYFDMDGSRRRSTRANDGRLRRTGGRVQLKD